MRRPITFMRRGRISDSRSASWRIRGPIFKISMVRGRSPRRALKQGRRCFKRKRGRSRRRFSGSGEHCSVAACRFTFASQWARPIRCCRRKRKHARNNGLSQLLGLRDGRTCQRFALIDIRSTSIRACASITQRESSRGVKCFEQRERYRIVGGSFHCYPK